jgi:hypothetical protein
LRAPRSDFAALPRNRATEKREGGGGGFGGRKLGPLVPPPVKRMRFSPRLSLGSVCFAIQNGERTKGHGWPDWVRPPCRPLPGQGGSKRLGVRRSIIGLGRIGMGLQLGPEQQETARPDPAVSEEKLRKQGAKRHQTTFMAGMLSSLRNCERRLLFREGFPKTARMGANTGETRGFSSPRPWSKVAISRFS